MGHVQELHLMGSYTELKRHVSVLHQADENFWQITVPCPK